MTFDREYLKSLSLRIYLEHSTEALGEIYRIMAQPLLGYLCFKGVPLAEADDLVTTAFVRGWEGMKVKRIESVQGYIYRIVHNTWLNSLRDRANRARKLENMWHHQYSLDEEITPFELVGTTEKGVLVALLLDMMTKDHREILILRYWKDLSQEEIAVRLNIKLGTVMSRLFRARQQFKQLIEDHGSPDELEMCA